MPLADDDQPPAEMSLDAVAGRADYQDGVNLTATINLGWGEVRDIVAPPALVILAAIPIAHRSGVRSRTIALAIVALIALAALCFLVFWLSFRNLEVEW